MKAQAKKKQRRLGRWQKWVIFLVSTLVVITLGVIFIVRLGHNPAEQEAKRALNGFSTAISGSWYCENGTPSGIVNDTPWWEEIYVSQVAFEEVAEVLEERLNAEGYSVEKEYIENSTDPYNKGKTYWEITGTHGQFRVEGRVATHDRTQNNCFPQSSNVDKSIEPKNYASVVVIQFKDNSQ